MNERKIRKIIHWGFTVFLVFYIITGFGITNFRIIEQLTFGIISKNTSFQLHIILIYPLLILLFIHIFLSIYKKNIFKKKDKRLE